MKRDFKVWLPGLGDTEDDADLVLHSLDAQDAAEVAVEGRCCGSDWSDHIDGEPIVAAVRDCETGERTQWSVSITASINYSAEQVEEAPAAGGGAL